MQLLAVTRGTLRGQGYIVSAALSASTSALERIEIDQLQYNVDLVNLMTYDLNERGRDETGSCPELSGHQAQMLTTTLPGNPNSRSCQAALDYLIHNKCIMKRVLLGIPCYARCFIGCDGPGQMFRSSEVVAYQDIPVPAEPNAREQVDLTVVAAHRTDEDMWTTYDNPQTVHRKGQFANLRGLGGVFYSDATMDHTSPARSLIVAGFDGLRAS